MKGYIDLLSSYRNKSHIVVLKLTQNIDVAGRHGATKSINNMDLTWGKASTNCEIAKWWKK